MGAYKEVKKKSKKGIFITMGALITLGAVSVYKKGKNLVSKIKDKMDMSDN